jgi:hypothetical protein
MTKQDKRRKPGKSTISDEKPLIPQKYETPFLIIMILLLLIVFFNKAFFEGKVFSSPDVIAPMSLQTYLHEASQEGVFPLWIPYVFSGMPSFASLMTAGTRIYDFTNYIFNEVNHYLSILLVNTDVGWAVLFYFFFGAGIFLLLRRLGIGKFASFFAAVATIFTMGIIIWIMVGHGTKIITISFFPYIFLLVLELYKKFRWSYLIGLTIAIHLMLEGSHIQMIFYTVFALGIYFVYTFFISLFKKENLLPIVRTGLLFVVAGVLAFAMSSDKYMSIFEYNKYSIRGATPIVQEGSTNSQGGAGLDYDYATSWSFSPGELTTFFVPSFYGFGDYEWSGTLSNNQPVRVNTYFGQMPFTDFPEYMGVITIILAVIGFVRNRKNRFVQFSLFTIIITLLISFGRNFSIIFDPMFYYFPYFNRFRSPSMILVIVQIFLPILAAFGIDAIIKARNAGDRNLAKRTMIWSGVFGALLLLTLLLQSSIQDMFLSLLESNPQGVANIAHEFGISSDQVLNVIFPQMIFPNITADFYISLFISIVTCGMIYLYLNNKMPTIVMEGVLIVVLLIDMWHVDAKPMSYSDKARFQDEFAKPDYVSYIQQDSSLYRVLQLQNLMPIYSNTLSYFSLQNAYGYTGAKLRNYQDMMDVAGITNPNILRLLGVRYIVSDKPDSMLGKIVFHGSQLLLRNDNTLPRAFFVNNYKVVPALSTLEALRDGTLDPAKTVYFETDPHLQIQPPDSSTFARFTSYKLQSMKIQVHASGNNFLVLSEVYYPKGWTAFVDNKETQIYQSDYLLRGIEIPEGDHSVELMFHPATYYMGRNVSLTTNIVLVLGIVGTASYSLVTRKRKKAEGPA